MTDAAVVRDSNVSDKEWALGDDALTKLFTVRYVRDAFRETLVDGYHWYQVEVPDGDQTRFFLICLPIFQAVGHGTRTLEYDTSRKHAAVDRFVFLKDAWRIKSDSVRQEGDVLAELNQACVPHASPPLSGTPTQETITPQYWKCKHSSSSSPSFPDDTTPTVCPLQRHVHYRYIVEEVGRPLRTAGNEQKLLSHIVDCVQGSFFTAFIRIQGADLLE
ncbi:hypothetical protein LXA43DRAFT_895005 [Ganoderma leucocontextum]|nr:hypothetical protein LXA43DRAFT_895005 [Ganoderma leucocontextum]